MPKSTLKLRRRDDGLYITGDPPARHTLSARWVARELAESNVAVHVIIKTPDGDVTYDLAGFELIDGDDQRPNFTGWDVQLCDDGRTGDQG